MYTFTVSDNGVELDSDKVDRLFQIGGNHITSVGTENEKGSGLGLVLSQELVHMNRGRIGVNSTPGVGSEFWFTLPAHKAGEGSLTAKHDA